MRTKHPFRVFILGGLFILAMVTAALGGTPTLLFRHINETNGLPDGTVFQIMQDHQGAMWFGTRNGVARYDGASMALFQHDDTAPDTLSHNDAGGVLEDHTGAIWIRTWGGGLNRLTPSTGHIQTFRNAPSEPSSLSEDRVQIHFEDSQGIIWAGTFSQGLNRFERQTETFTRFTADGTPGALSHNRIWCFAETRDHTLYVGTENGLNRFNRREQSFTPFTRSTDAPDALPHDQIRAIYPAGGSTLWVGTPLGFRLFDTRTERCIPFPGMDHLPPEVASAAINTLYDDGRTLWVGTQNHGLLILDLETGLSTLHQNVPYLPGSLSHNDIRWITEDRSGVIWIGTRGGGVNTLSKFLYQIKLFMPGYSGDDLPLSIHAVAANAGGGLWAGSWYTGLHKQTGPQGAFVGMESAPPPHGTGSPDINALSLGPDGTLWIGTWGEGLLRREPGASQFTRWSQRPSQPDTRTITALSAHTPGVIWAGSRNQGLFRYDTATEKVRRFTRGAAKTGGLTSNTIHALLEDDRNNVWVGTNLGLNRIGADGEKVTQFPLQGKAAVSLSNNLITCLAETHNEGIWVGTYNGLNRLNPRTETIRTYFMDDGLSGNIIKSLAYDGNRRLWVATDQGLCAIDLKNDSISRFPLPLRFLQGAATRSPEGKVIFAGENGYLLITPEEVPLTRPAASLRLTGLSLNGTPVVPGVPVNNRPILTQPLNETERLDLSHTETTLSFSFALHDFNDPTRNRYRYKLVGYDTDWVDAGNTTTARYPHLPSGSYHFQVMAAGSQGVWNRSHPGIEVHIGSPFWKRWYMPFTVLLLIAGLLHARFSIIGRRNRDLELLVIQRTREFNEQARRYERLSLTDPLTGLMNRRGIVSHEKRLRSQARREQRPFALILASIDHFEAVKENFGHDCEDFILQRLGNLLDANLRVHDILGRWNGEEFIVLLPATNEEEARILAERLRNRIEVSLFEWNRTHLDITLTLKVVGCDPDETFEQCIDKADAALADEHRVGRNRVVMASS